MVEEKDLLQICEQAFGDAIDVEFHCPLTGGAHRRTFLFSKEGELLVLRHYRGKHNLCRLEKNLLEKVQGKVPVQELVYTDPKKGIAIFKHAPGNLIIDIENPTEVSYALGKVLAAIHGFTFERAGLFDSHLNIAKEFQPGSEPYYFYLIEHFNQEGRAWKFMGDDLAGRLLRFVQEHRLDFPIAGEGGVLVHSDFKPVNLIWDDENGLTVLDWEFAHSGDPLLDFGTIIRHYNKIPLEISSLERGYTDAGGSLPKRWVQRARVLDFLNYVQLMNSKLDRPKMYEHLIKCIMLTMDEYANLDGILREGKR